MTAKNAEQTEQTPLVKEIASKHPADAAEIIEQMSPEEGAKILEALPAEQAADALEQIPAEEAAVLVHDMAPKEAAEAVEKMEPDDAADLLAAMPEQQRDELLAAMNAEYARTVRELMRYPEDTAGGLMTSEYVALPEHITVGDAINDLRRMATEDQVPVNYVYVIDRNHRLVGVLALRNLLLTPAHVPIRNIMIRDVVSVPATMDAEEVARLFAKYDFIALPVVDGDGHLLGVITVDDIVDVINEEASEDMQKMVGAGGDEHLDTPVRYSLRKRLPWLVVNLGTAFLASSVVGLFEDTIRRVALLAVLMPIVAGQAGNTGAQSLAVMIRAIALGEMERQKLRKILRRELALGAVSGLCIGLVAGVGVFLWTGEIRFATVMAVAMVLALSIATVAGAFVPLVLRWLGFDPAQASSIILTTITDCIGFGSFLALATLGLKLWPAATAVATN